MTDKRADRWLARVRNELAERELWQETDGPHILAPPFLVRVTSGVRARCVEALEDAAAMVDQLSQETGLLPVAAVRQFRRRGQSPRDLAVLRWPDWLALLQGCRDCGRPRRLGTPFCFECAELRAAEARSTNE